MEQEQVLQILKYAWPLIVLQLGLQIYCIIDLIKHQKTKTLSFPVWLVIVLVGEILGAVLYLLLGKSEEL